jgi:hypothetical protein
MANVRSSNTFYIDTAYSSSTDELVQKNLKLLSVSVTATSANAVVVLTDSGTKKLDLRVATSGVTTLFDYSECPILFANSIRPTTLTNAVVTCVFQELRS